MNSPNEKKGKYPIDYEKLGRVNHFRTGGNGNYGK
jgi:hypothetical protein